MTGLGTARAQADTAAAPRVAVIAVHGVADQKPGETAQALVALLAGSAFEVVPSDTPVGPARYEAVGCESFTLPVDPLRPRAPCRRGHEAEPATPFSKDRRLRKSWRQSLRSDIVDPSLSPALAAAAPGPGTRAAAGAAMAADPGLTVTNYLLGKHFDNGGVNAPYDSRVTRLQRSVEGRRTHEVDVFEMHWADLSRLSDKTPRIVAELFTLLFRFSRLGREAVSLASASVGRRSMAWRATSFLQAALDWFLVNVLAMFTLLLLLAGVTVMVTGAAITDGHGLRAAVVPFLPWGYVLVGSLLLAYRVRATDARAWREWIVPVVLVLAGLALVALPQGALWAGIAGYFVLVTVAVAAGLRVADDRFPLVRFSGLAFWYVGAAAMLLPALWTCGPWARSCSPAWPLTLLLDGSLHVLEGVLYLGFKLPWLGLVPWVMLAWLAAGLVAGWGGGFAARATIATGRLGLVVSTAAFLAVAMLVWAGAQRVLPASVGWSRFTPIFCHVGEACDVWAAAFLEQRFSASTAGFVLIVLILGLLVLYLMLTLLPSLLAEMLLLVDRRRETVRRHAHARHRAPRSAAELLERGRRARQLGRWLTSHYRQLDTVALVITLLALAAALVIALAFMGVDAFDAVYVELQRRSQGLLRPLAISATSVVAFFIAFGGLLSRYAPTLRGPLDVALDVDNHFREFPRAAIPRARIFSRYAALLGKIQRDGYDRIVIVAHSQGSVITAELLRYLSSPGALAAPGVNDSPRLPDAAARVPAARLLPPIHLLTLGCPLRQLYATRFPWLYQWVYGTDGYDPFVGVCGPRTHDVGVQRWFNAFCSGGYVGRWLWSGHARPDAAVPLADTACDAAGIGRLDAYALLQLPPGSAEALNHLAGMPRVETCLGVGAHTHYFDPGQEAVAWLVDHLID